MVLKFSLSCGGVSKWAPKKRYLKTMSHSLKYVLISLLKSKYSLRMSSGFFAKSSLHSKSIVVSKDSLSVNKVYKSIEVYKVLSIAGLPKL